MEKQINNIIKFGYSLLLFISIFWLFVSIGYGSMLSENLNTYGYIFAAMVGISLISKKVRDLLKRLMRYAYLYWYLTIVALVIFQVIIILSNSVLVYGDIVAVIENIRGVGNFNYFSAFSNNYVYGLYIKALYNIFGLHYLVFVQELINIFILDASIIIFSRKISKYYNRDIASIYFLLSIALIGLHPQFLSTYTDYWSYFTATIITLGFIKLLKRDTTKFDYIILFIFVGLGYLIRPTILIYVIALIGVLILKMTINFEKKLCIRISKGLLVTILSMVFAVITISMVKQTNILRFKPGYDKNLMYYFDLGLTSTGAAHIELPPKALDQNSPDTIVEPLIDKDIKERIKRYSVKQFFTKFKIAFQEGNLGWRIEHPLAYTTFQKIR